MLILSSWYAIQQWANKCTQKMNLVAKYKINYNIESADILALGLLFISAAVIYFCRKCFRSQLPWKFVSSVGILSLVGVSFIICWCKLMVYGIVQNLRRMSRHQIFILECTIAIKHTKHVIIETYLLMNTYILIDTYILPSWISVVTISDTCLSCWQAQSCRELRQISLRWSKSSSQISTMSNT